MAACRQRVRAEKWHLCARREGVAEALQQRAFAICVMRLYLQAVAWRGWYATRLSLPPCCYRLRRWRAMTS